MTTKKSIGISVIGMGWMGCVHARAFTQLSRLTDLPLAPRLVMCSDESAEKQQWAREAFGFAAVGGWREAIEETETDVVCIAAPTHLHTEMVEAAAAAGKHVYCEKPVGRGVDDASRAEKAARDAGVLSAVGYNYRYFPMVQYCRQLLDSGRLGGVEQFNARFLSMYGGNPLSRLTWRFQNEFSGSGAVADILSHAVDTAHYLAGAVKRVTATGRTFIRERPQCAPGSSHFSLGADDDPKGKVENEDYIGVLAEFDGGGVGCMEASRVARGPKCEMGFDLYGEKGSARWNFERMNELSLYLPDNDAAHDGYVNLLAGAAHPDHARFNPGDGIGVGYEDSKMLEVIKFLREIAAGEQTESGLAQALRVAQVNDAVLRSAVSRRWEEVER